MRFMRFIWSRGIFVLIGVGVGGCLGGYIGYAVGGQSAGAIGVGIVIGAAVGGLVPLIPSEVWEALGGLVELADCCSTFTSLIATCIVTGAGFLLWHSILAAALAGGSALLLLFIGLVIINLSAAKQKQVFSHRASDHLISQQG